MSKHGQAGRFRQAAERIGQRYGVSGETVLEKVALVRRLVAQHNVQQLKAELEDARKTHRPSPAGKQESSKLEP